MEPKRSAPRRARAPRSSPTQSVSEPRSRRVRHPLVYQVGNAGFSPRWSSFLIFAGGAVVSAKAFRSPRAPCNRTISSQSRRALACWTYRRICSNGGVRTRNRSASVCGRRVSRSRRRSDPRPANIVFPHSGASMERGGWKRFSTERWCQHQLTSPKALTSEQNRRAGGLLRNYVSLRNIRMPRGKAACTLTATISDRGFTREQSAPTLPGATRRWCANYGIITRKAPELAAQEDHTATRHSRIDHREGDRLARERTRIAAVLATRLKQMTCNRIHHQSTVFVVGKGASGILHQELDSATTYPNNTYIIDGFAALTYCQPRSRLQDRGPSAQSCAQRRTLFRWPTAPVDTLSLLKAYSST